MTDTPQKSAAAPTEDTTPQTLKAGVAKCKRKRKNLVDDWAVNVEYARGKPFDQESDADRVYVNSDNTMSRRKAAQLASQLPEARLKPKKGKEQQVGPILGQFASKLNDTIREAGVGDALFETSKDAVNAAGFGFVLCGYEARTETRQELGIDPKTLSPDQLNGLQTASQLDEEQAQELLKAYGIPIVDVPHVVSSRFYADRKSPSDFLWPLEFERSNFDKAPWLGHSDRMGWAEAKRAFNLNDEDKQRICGPRNGAETNLRDDTGHESDSAEEVVEYDELFYWRAKYDPDELQLHAIWRIVYVNGLDKPAYHGPWEGQKMLPKGGYAGACKLPIRVLTLDYISDDAIPPSDSAIARPQVNEMIRSRTQMVQQRERSLPMRWHDVNRIDPLTSSNLMKGVWQNSIPVKGNGNSIMGEVARANYPQEDFGFDRIIKSDLNEAWQIDNNQMGMFAQGRRTAEEAKVVQANFSTQIGFQRARVGAFFCGIAEVLAGLISLLSEDLPSPPAPPQQPGQPPAPQMDVKQLSQAFDYSILPDSTVLLDANQRAAQLVETLDMVGKSGFINPQPLIVEILEYRGVDPAMPGLLITPDTKKEEPPNISYRFSGVADLLNPIVMAMLLKAGQAPSPEELKAAMALLQSAGVPVGMPSPPLPADPNAPPDGAKPEMPPADARPDWTAMPSVTKRSE